MKDSMNDHDEYWQIWEHFKPDILAYCLRWENGDRYMAEEISSICLIKGLSEYNKHRDSIRNPGPWLKTLVHNACIDLYRKKKRERNNIQKLAADTSYFFAHHEYMCESPEQVSLKEQFFSEINHSIESMPEKMGQAFKMHVLEDMSYTDISNTLKITQQTARKRVQLARKYIKETVFT